MKDEQDVQRSTVSGSDSSFILHPSSLSIISSPTTTWFPRCVTG